jgi:hypothetical protein
MRNTNCFTSPCTKVLVCLAVVILAACDLAAECAPATCPTPLPACLTDGGLLGATPDAVTACAGTPCAAVATSENTQTWTYCPGVCEANCARRVSVHFSNGSVVAVGTPATVTSMSSCIGALSLAGRETEIRHSVWRWSDATTTTACAVTRGGVEARAAASYASGATGAPGGDCILTHDDGTWWRASLTQDPGQSVVEGRAENEWRSGLLACDVRGAQGGEATQAVERPPEECATAAGCGGSGDPAPQPVTVAVSNTATAPIEATLTATVAGLAQPPSAATYAPGQGAAWLLTTAEPGQRVAVRVFVPASNQYAETEVTAGPAGLVCAVTLGEAWGIPMGSVSCTAA